MSESDLSAVPGMKRPFAQLGEDFACGAEPKTPRFACHSLVTCHPLETPPAGGHTCTPVESTVIGTHLNHQQVRNAAPLGRIA